jgi:hypothetical protein
MENQRGILAEDLAPLYLADKDRVVSPREYFGNTTFKVGHTIIQNWGARLSRMVRMAHQATGVVRITTGEGP